MYYQSLRTPEKYPPPVRKELQELPNLAIVIANRWVLGWPRKVRSMLMAGSYLEILKQQLEKEEEALSQPGLSHLSDWEKLEVLGAGNGGPP